MYSPDGGFLASGSSDYTVRLWDSITGQHKLTVKGHTGPIFSVAYSPNGRTLASGSGQLFFGNRDNTVRLWDASTGANRAILIGHTGSVTSLAYSPDGSTLASGSWDDTVRLWDVSTGQHKATLTGHNESVNSVSFSPNGTTLASGSWDDTVRLWNAATGQHKATLTGHTESVNSISFSPDGTTLASGSKDGTVRLWDVLAHNLRATLIGHTDFVMSVAYSTDGGVLASGSKDSTVRLWNAFTGVHRKTLTGHTATVYSVSWAPDSRTLASGSEDGTVLLWNVDGAKPRMSQQSSLTHHESLERQMTVQRSPQQIAKTALNSTVLVVMEDANGQPLSSGSGFFVGRGMIATNLHVVEGVFNGYIKRVGMNRTYRIKNIIAMNSQQDLAILKVSDIGAPILPLGNSDELKIGEPVYAVGNPKGYLEGTFTEGIVSGVREFQINSKRIQISAPVSEGSSGGPVLNSRGEVIGVAVSKLTEGQNLNFAVPSNYLKELLSKVGGTW